MPSSPSFGHLEQPPFLSELTREYERIKTAYEHGELSRVACQKIIQALRDVAHASGSREVIRGNHSCSHRRN